MDNIINATRISSSNENMIEIIEHDPIEGKESSNPFDNSHSVAPIGRIFEPLDNSNPIERDLNSFHRPNKIRKTKMVNGPKIRSPKIAIDPPELLYLNMLLLGEQKLSQMTNNNIISRMKGKKSPSEYLQTLQTIRRKRETFESRLGDIYNKYLPSINICIFPIQAMNELMELFHDLPFVNRKEKQKEKFRVKIEARLQSCGFKIEQPSPVNFADIKQKLQIAFPGNELSKTLDLLRSPNIFELMQ